jgi:hypothetical protein
MITSNFEGRSAIVTVAHQAENILPLPKYPSRQDEKRPGKRRFDYISFSDWKEETM